MAKEVRTPESLGLGRLPAPDPRDGAFRMGLLIPEPPKVDHKYWNANGWWGDQGGSSQCVAYAWTHYLEDGPVTHSGSAPVIEPAMLYHQAQLVDEWPGEDYDGTSVRAAAKVLQGLGWIESYHWAWSADEIINAILTLGPVVIGTNWYQGMFYPDPKTNIIKPTGYVAGGHATKLDGANRRNGLIRLKNSWSRAWGKKGHVWVEAETLQRLMNEDGEACIAVEAKH
jgi:hypothetical protein